MSKDSTIYLKQIDSQFYIMEGCASCEYTVADFLAQGRWFASREKAIVAAHDLSIQKQTEYGITELDSEDSPTKYPFSGYCFGRYELQGKGGPLVIKSCLVDFRDIPDDTAKQLSMLIASRWPYPDVASPIATSFYQMAACWRLAVNEQPKEIQDAIYKAFHNVRELNGWKTEA